MEIPPAALREAVVNALVHRDCLINGPRNPYIYARVAERALATRAGTGIRRIARLLRENNGTELGISISDAEVVLTLPRRRQTKEPVAEEV